MDCAGGVLNQTFAIGVTEERGLTLGDNLKARMQAGIPVIGCWINLFDNLASEIIAKAGYDFVMIDMEHGPGDITESISVMQALGHSCPALARVPGNDPVWIKRILDAGVDGVMVPAVNSQEEAIAAAAACHYAPRGNRGMAAVVVRAADYGANWREYIQRIEEEVLVICQIETAEAVENAAEIATVEDVDLLFIGPFDLSASLGFLGQPDHPDVMAAISRVEAAAISAGKLLGGISTPGRGVGDLLSAGYRMILPDSDLALLREGARSSVEQLRELLDKSETTG